MSPPPSFLHNLRAMFSSRRMAVVGGLGFASGLPLLLTGQTLSAWMTVEGIDLKTISAFSLVALPYTFKFTWAPLLDRYPLPWLGRRRGWIFTLQLLLIAAIATMGTVQPRSSPALLAVLAVLVAFLSASQDVMVDAYNTDVLPPEQRAAGSAVYVLAYRLAMLVTGTLALVLADFISWRTIYWILAACMGVGVVATLAAEEPARSRAVQPSLAEALIRPFSLMLRRERALALLAFVALYKFGDQLASVLTIPFLKKEMGFLFTEIAAFNKVLGFVGVLLGGTIAGVLVPRLGLRRALFVFGLAQAATNLAYASLAAVGKSHILLGAAVLIDNTANAMGTGAFVALMMSLCDRSVSATQYALLGSLSTVVGRFLGASAGHVTEALGWVGFFAATAALAAPGLLLLSVLPAQHFAGQRAAPPADDAESDAGRAGG
jgi:PAT family beta-lactamase induction signal transducer AmpG